MTARKPPSISTVLVGYGILVLVVSATLVVTNAPTPLQMLLFAPVMLAAPFYPRWVYLAMLLFLDAVTLWVVYERTLGSGGVYQIILALSLMTGLVAEGFHQLARQRAHWDAALRESELRYRGLIEHLPEPVVVHYDGTIAYANPAAMALLGAKKANDLLGRPLVHIIHEDFHDEIEQRLRLLQEGSGSLEPTIQKLVCLDGREVIAEVISSRTTYKDRPASQAVIRDITRQTHAEQARRLAEEALQYRLHLEELITSISTKFIHVPVAQMDDVIREAIEAIGKFVHADRSYIFQYQDNGTVIRNTHEWCAPGISSQIDNLQEIPTSAIPWWQDRLERFENILITQVDALPPAAAAERELLKLQDIRSLIVVPLRYGKNLRGFLGFDAVREERAWADETVALLKIVGEILMNTLERRRAERDLQAQRDFALQVMNALGQGLTVTDREGRFEYVNPAFARMLGYDASDLVGRSSSDVMLPVEPESVDRDKTGDLREHSSTYETRLIRADGEVLYTLVTSAPRRQEGQIVGTIDVHTDLTERKRMEEALARARDQALESSRLKSEFLATMSHEIRTPMNAIIGMTELLLYTGLSKEQEEYANVVNEAAQGLLTIINDILDFSRIEADKLELEHIEFDLLRLVEGTAEVLNTKARSKGLTLMTFVSPRLPYRLRGDPGRLRQVLLNLIGNAVKFTDRGEVDVQAHLVLQSASEVIVRFSVRDTGIGLSEQARKRLFQPFTQADGSTTREYGGSGLGLAISRRLVEMMGGEIGVESTQGEGATFWFTARFEPVTDESREARAELGPLRVLIVDGNELDRKILHRYIRSWGIYERMALGGGEALHLLEEATRQGAPYDLVILDRQAAGMDPFTFAARVRQTPALAATRLILLISVDEHDQGEMALQRGYSAYLTKPLRQSHLFDAIASIRLGAETVALAATERKSLIATGPAGQSPESESASEEHTLVMLVEDNPANQQLAARQLTRLGYAVQSVDNGREALRRYLDDPTGPAAILMDCHMPEMDGFETTRAIRQAELTLGYHIPIIAMTANAMEGDRENCLAAGMDDYISKPVTLKRLKETLSHWVSVGRSRASRPAAPMGETTSETSETLAPPLNREVLAQLYELQEESDEGEPHLVMALIDLFLRDTPAMLVTLRKAVNEEDASALHRAAHSFKGTCATLGATVLASYCRELERCGARNDFSEARRWLQRIEVEHPRVLQAMREERDRIEQGT